LRNRVETSDEEPPVSSDVREKLKAELMTASWVDLKDHAERNAVFLVSQDLDLVAVGEKIAADDSAAVAGWINDGSLSRPTPAQMATWSSDAGKAFNFMILQPHILIQELAH
jgi:hypothetical protein